MLSYAEKAVIYRIMSGRVTAKRAKDYTEGGNDYLSLVDHMLAAYRSQGFVIAIIVGVLGGGKSYYALTAACQFLREIGKISGGDLTSCLREALDNYTAFVATEADKVMVLKALRAKGKKSRAELLEKMPTLESKVDSVSWLSAWPVLVWDDAGVFGSNYRFYIDKRFVWRLSSLMQVIRRRVRSFVVTTPNPDFVLAAVKKIPERLIIVAEPREEWWSVVKAYRFKLTGAGEYVELVFQDRFWRKVPDDFHMYYMRLSDLYTDAALALSSYYGSGELEEEEGGAPVFDVRQIKVLKLLATGKWFKAKDVAAGIGMSVSAVKTYIMPPLVAMGYVVSSKRYGYKLTKRGVTLLRELGLVSEGAV